jgi:hypothetical protein
MGILEMIDELIALLHEQPWMECREIRAVEEQGRLSLVGEWIIPYLEGVERLAYLVSDAASLAREAEDPALAEARFHAEMLPSPAEEETFPFRVWTDPLPAASFHRLVAVLSEALRLGEEEESGEEGLIQLDGS